MSKAQTQMQPQVQTQVFVFGSNEAGIHGAGAAKFAYQKRGARWGFSYGHMGNSWAIPTKDQFIQTLSTERIEAYVKGFLAYAEGHPELTFQVTRIGCGLAGLSDAYMSQLFDFAPLNCEFDTVWVEHLPVNRGIKFWGTF
jgi:hypothetical protein